MDLGECPRIHDLALKADFEMASANRDYYYDIDVSCICVLIDSPYLNNFLLNYQINVQFGHKMCVYYTKTVLDFWINGIITFQKKLYFVKN